MIILKKETFSQYFQQSNEIIHGNIMAINPLLCCKRRVGHTATSSLGKSGLDSLICERFDQRFGQQVTEFPNNVPRLEKNPLWACHGLANDA